MEVSAILDRTAKLQRRLGYYKGDTPGPLLICIAGMHGNEPAGILALTEVLDQLQATRPPLRGEVLALAGNLTALGRGCRFIDRDLNRQWISERIEHLRKLGARAAATSEDMEQWQLLTAIESVMNGRAAPAIFLDLHTASGPGAPFTIIEDTMANRELAFNLPMPVILGLEERVDGTFTDYTNGSGNVGIGIEGGQHWAASAVDHHQAAVWITLVTAGMIAPGDVPDLARHRRLLSASTRGLPPVFETRYRHAVTIDDGFVMEPGLANFSPVRRNQVVAHDRHGPIRARESGRLLLPLYQSQGSDGFFIIRPVRPFWLWAAGVLRRLHVDRWLHWLPGVHRDPTPPHGLLVDRRIARFLVLEIFHLLGYRRCRAAGKKLVLTRRSYETRPPRGL